jgi:hypothetical protein
MATPIPPRWETPLPPTFPGDQLFLNKNGSVLNALQDLYTSLNSGNNIPAAVTEIENSLGQLGVQRVAYGNALNQINLSESFLNQDTLNHATAKLLGLPRC